MGGHRRLTAGKGDAILLAEIEADDGGRKHAVFPWS